MHVLGGKKNWCSSKFVQFLLLNRVKARWSKNCSAQGFHYINLFSSNFLGPNSKTCTCKVHAAWGRVSRGLTVLTFTQGRNPGNFLFLFWEKQWLHKSILELSDLYLLLHFIWPLSLKLHNFTACGHTMKHI